MENAVSRAEMFVLGQARETVVVLDPHGNIRYQGAGERDRVSVPRAILAGGIVVHNHPGGGSLSRQDVKVMLDHQVSQMRVVTTDAVYVLDRPENTSWTDVEQLVAVLMDQVRDEHRDLMLDGKMSYEESERRRWHDVWTAMAEIRGWRYRRQARQTS